MKTLVIFPGNSPRNKEWGEKITEHFGVRFDRVYAQSYDHWASGEENINFEIELEKLKLTMATMPPDTVIYVFAKSAGTLLTLMAVARGIIAPRQCVFFGMPLQWAERDVFMGDWSTLASFRIPTLAFHNDHDPVTAYDFAKDIIASNNDVIKLIKTSGSDHSYTEFANYESALADF